MTAYRHQEEVKLANYIARGTLISPPHVGDGGMNRVFMTDLAGSSTDTSGRYSVASLTLQPGVALAKVPSALPHVPNPPGTTIPKVGAALEHASETAVQPAPASQPWPASQPEPKSQPVMMASVPMPEPAPLPKEGQLLPQKKLTSIASLLGNLFSAKKQAPPAAAAPQVANADSNAPAVLRGTNTDMAATPKQKPGAATVRIAATPIKRPSDAHKGS